jgi:hypothetical protein
MSITTLPRSCAALFCLITLFVAGIAGAETRSVNGAFAGSFHPTGVDSDADTNAGVALSSSGRTALGSATREGWVEVLPFDGVSFCGPTHVLLQYRFVDVVTRFADRSQIFSQLVSGALCFDFASGGFTASAEMQIVGGTGRFKGATGRYSFEVRQDHGFASGLGAYSETNVGTLTLPDDD